MGERNYSEYSWKHGKLLNEMSEDELREALAESLDVLTDLADVIETSPYSRGLFEMLDKVLDWVKDREYHWTPPVK